MAIYDEEKMKQKVIYPTKQTPSYADWALYNMGKDLEDKVDSIPTSKPYTAGSGISISEENVISNTAQPDVNKAYVDTADNNLQQQIDGIVASTDVKDVVGTYAQLQTYDTTTLGNNDIVKVLQDSTHSDALTYYRWVITEGVGAWNYIGQEGPFYTKSQTDTLMQDKVDTDLSNVDVGQATAGQVLAVNSSANGVEWQDIVAGGGYEIVFNNFYAAVLNAGGSSNFLVSLDKNYDYIITTIPTSGYTYVPNNTTSNVSSIYVGFYNKGYERTTVGAQYNVYRRPKVGTTNRVDIIGCIGSSAIFIRTGGTANQVFKKTGSGYAEGKWQDISEVPSSAVSDAGKVLTVDSSGSAAWATPSGGSGLTAHTYNTYKELADDFVLHPDAILVSNNDIQLILTDNNTKIRITTTYARYTASTPVMSIHNIDETINIDSSLNVSSLALTIGYFAITTNSNTFTKSSINISVDSFKLLY